MLLLFLPHNAPRALAATVAEPLPLTVLTLGVSGLGGGKRVKSRIYHDLGQWPFKDVPQFEILLHEEITGIHVAVVLDDHIAATLRLENAHLRVHVHVGHQHSIERSLRDQRLASVVPPVEQLAEEAGVLPRSHRKLSK